MDEPSQSYSVAFWPKACDYFFSPAIGLLQVAILFVFPAVVAFIATHSFLVASVTYFTACAFVLLFSVCKLTVSAKGIRFVRILGYPKILPWDRILSIEPASRKEVIIHGWLWPIFPNLDASFSLRCSGHFRIIWDSGFCYYAPADADGFRQNCASYLRQSSNKRETHPVSNRKHIAILLIFFASVWAFAGVLWGVFLCADSDVIVIGHLKESHIGEPENRIDAYVPGGEKEQFFWVSFGDLQVLKGKYANETLGFRLHSPAMTFGIRTDRLQSRPYVLFMNNHVAKDGSKKLILNAHF